MRIRTSVCLDQSPEMRLNSDENETPCCAKSGFLMNKRRPWVSGSEIERVPGQRLVVNRWLARKKRVRTMLIRAGFPLALGWVSRGWWWRGAARRGGESESESATVDRYDARAAVRRSESTAEAAVVC